MIALKNSQTFQQLVRGLQATSYVMALGFLAVLAVMWVLTGQLFQLGERIAENIKLSGTNN